MIISKVTSCFNTIYKSIRFFYHWQIERRKYGKYYFSMSEKLKDMTMIVLANGPSLNDDMEAIKERVKNDGALVYAVNDFAMSSFFQELQPQYYCFIDRLYFREDVKEYRIYQYLNSVVNWDMLLFIPIDKYKFVVNRLNNNRIKVTPITTLQYEGFANIKYPTYKKGRAVPSFVNVVNLAVYTSLNMGIKRIFLYGVDHTFLKLIYVDDNNTLCLKDEHFYGTEIINIAPKTDGSSWNVADFVYDKYLTFKEHDNLRGYADYLGAEIINCTKCSCIDSYTRLSQIEDR